MVRTLILVSGAGTNMEALIKVDSAYTVDSVVADRDCPAVQKARKLGIWAEVFPRKGVSEAVLRYTKERGIQMIVCAGFLSILEGELLKEYSGRILNLHPSLLPAFGGKGMYGKKVFEAVLASGIRETGCTVHLVEAGVDSGPILLQRKCPVMPGDTAQLLAERLAPLEHEAIVAAANLLARRIEGATI